jgi:hypothetical protein
MFGYEAVIAVLEAKPEDEPIVVDLLRPDG